MNNETPPLNTKNLKQVPAEKYGVEQDIQSLEQELSPEILEMIMDKVVDIDNADNVAFHVLRGNALDLENIKNSQDLKNELEELHNKFKNILQSGLIGQTWREESDTQLHYTKIHKYSQSEIKKNYIDQLKKKRHPLVHANLLPDESSSILLSKGASRLAYLDYLGYGGGISRAEEPIIMFDTSSFEYKEEYEIMQTTKVNKLTTKLLEQKSGSGEYGELFYPRVSNRFFKGIIFNYVEPELWKELNPNWNQLYEEMKRYSKIRNKNAKEIANEYAQIMIDVFKKKPNLLIPIYDLHGNLWWPKQMSYEEIKKFVTEKEKSEGKNSKNLPE